MKCCQDSKLNRLIVRSTLGLLLLVNLQNLVGLKPFFIFLFIVINILLFIVFIISEKLAEAEIALKTELKIQEELLFQEARVAEIGRMMGAITHEINNPIGIIKTQAIRGIMMLEKNNIEIEAHKKLYESIKNNSERTGAIITNIKNAISKKLNQEEVGKYPVTAILNKAVEFLQIKIKKTTVKIEYQIADTDEITCNFSQLKHVFLNLISNSIDAIKEQNDPWIKFLFRADQDFYYITAIDSGNGIPDEYLAKIEKGFFTSKGDGEGSGQGLVLCKKILRNHGGELYYVKAPNTTFELKLPKKLELA